MMVVARCIKTMAFKLDGNMKLAPHSRNRFLESLSKYEISRDYIDPVYNYLVSGWGPGSFFTAVMANDYLRAMLHSHPGNSVAELKKLASWMFNEMPEVARGSFKNVDLWTKMSDAERRKILVEHNLVYTEEEDVMMVLRGDTTHEPFFW